MTGLYRAILGIITIEIGTTVVAAQRQLSAALLAASIHRYKRWHTTTFHDRAQPKGRASGVRCKAMLGGVGEKYN